MSTRKRAPSATTQLRKLKAEHATLQQDAAVLQQEHARATATLSAQASENVALNSMVAELRKQLEQAKVDKKKVEESLTYHMNRHTALQSKLEEAHNLLDALPDPPARNLAEDNACFGPREISLAGRLTAWIAARSAR